MPTRITVLIESFGEGESEGAFISGSARKLLQRLPGRDVVTRDEISIALLEVGEKAMKGHATARSGQKRRHGKLV